MKRRINACASCALLFTIIAQLFALNACAAPAANTGDEQIEQLLDQLGVRALLEQTSAILTTAIEAETQFLGTKPQPANWRRELETQLKSPVILQNVMRFLRERSGKDRADTIARAQQRLQEPIAKRARYFDLAMTQPGAEKNLRDFISQNGLSQNGLPQTGLAQHKTEHADNAANPGAEARRAVLSEIDAASSSSLLMAALQSAIAARVRQASGGGAIDAELLKDEIAERERFLAPLAVDYLFYDYRYLRDDELHGYRDLLRDDSVQWVLDICYQAVLSAVAGELTPPAMQRQGQPR